ncbi:hypothetical protein F4810DRAFT_681721 [Camillea tinctor]|nr:hypothetical protein F4810DRAFT_681721 [Camillea tinctor]
MRAVLTSIFRSDSSFLLVLSIVKMSRSVPEEKSLRSQPIFHSLELRFTFLLLNPMACYFCVGNAHVDLEQDNKHNMRHRERKRINWL